MDVSRRPPHRLNVGREVLVWIFIHYSKRIIWANSFAKKASLCQRLGLTPSVRNKPRARSASIERRRRESPPEAKDERSESFAGGARKRFCEAKPSLWTYTSSSVQTWSVNSKKSLPKNELNTAYFYWSQRKPIDNNGRSILCLGW